jgi:hypothetical protein
MGDVLCIDVIEPVLLQGTATWAASRLDLAPFLLGIGSYESQPYVSRLLFQLSVLFVLLVLGIIFCIACFVLFANVLLCSLMQFHSFIIFSLECFRAYDFL